MLVLVAFGATNNKRWHARRRCVGDPPTLVARRRGSVLRGDVSRAHGARTERHARDIVTRGLEKAAY